MKRIILFILIASIVIAQEANTPKDKAHTFLRVGYQAGAVLQTSEFLQGENATGTPVDYFQSARLEFGWQTSGSADWHQVFNNPSYGVGLYGANFFNTTEIGTPSAIYGFFDWPFKRYEQSAISAEFGFGIAYDWQPFDPDSNPYNLVIGAGRSVYIDVGLKYTYQISQHLDISGQISFSHFSNGSTQQPNAGINLLSPRINLAYNFQDERPIFIKRELPEFITEYEFTTSLTYGSKSQVYNVINPPSNSTKFDSLKRESFDVFAFIATLNKQVSYNSKLGLGAEVEYDPSLGVEYEYKNGEKKIIDSDTSEKVRIGIFAQYSLVISKLEGLIGMGYYVMGETSGSIKKMYQRLGARYYIFDNFSAGLNLRFYDFSRADNMEFNIGYRFDLGL
ncbi:MAG: acyloxyacyl hydrolase [Melioribacteraceae bacterium]|nr:acyloxyacyl hydrolase [Melioribacteraceae bacterium]